MFYLSNIVTYLLVWHQLCFYHDDDTDYFLLELGNATVIPPVLLEVCIIYRGVEVTIAFINNDKSRNDQPSLSFQTSKAEFLIHLCYEGNPLYSTIKRSWYDVKYIFERMKIPPGKWRREHDIRIARMIVRFVIFSGNK